MMLRKDLREQYEDAVFALALDAIAAEEGEALLRENERLKADPDFLIPAPADRGCRKTIVRGFRRQRCKRTLRAAGRTLQRISVVACAVLLLFTGVYATRPETRPIRTHWIPYFVRNGIGRVFSSSDVDGQLPYELDVLPEGFSLNMVGSNGVNYWKYYTDSDDRRIELDEVDAAYGASFNISTNRLRDGIQVNGNEGVLAVTDNWIRAQIMDQKHQIFIDVTFYGLCREEVLHVLSGLTYTGVDFYGTPFQDVYG